MHREIQAALNAAATIGVEQRQKLCKQCFWGVKHSSQLNLGKSISAEAP
jgi:hypothetical protein